MLFLVGAAAGTDPIFDSVQVLPNVYGQSKCMAAPVLGMDANFSSSSSSAMSQSSSKPSSSSSSSSPWISSSSSSSSPPTLYNMYVMPLMSNLTESNTGDTGTLISPQTGMTSTPVFDAPSSGGHDPSLSIEDQYVVLPLAIGTLSSQYTLSFWVLPTGTYEPDKYGDEIVGQSFVGTATLGQSDSFAVYFGAASGDNRQLHWTKNTGGSVEDWCNWIFPREGYTPCWYQFTLTLNTTTAVMYANGIQVCVNYIPAAYTGSSQLYLGYAPALSPAAMDGFFQWLAWSPYSWTQAEVDSWFEATNTGSCSVVTVSHPLDSSSSSPYVSSSSSSSSSAPPPSSSLRISSSSSSSSPPTTYSMYVMPLMSNLTESNTGDTGTLVPTQSGISSTPAFADPSSGGHDPSLFLEDQYVTLPLAIGTVSSQYTLSFWVLPTSAYEEGNDGNQIVGQSFVGTATLGQSDSFAVYFGAATGDNWQLHWTKSTGGSADDWCNWIFPPEGYTPCWYQFTFTLNATTAVMYANGIQVCVNYNPAAYTGSSQLYLGYAPALSLTSMDGFFQWLAWSSYSWTQAEVDSWFEATNTGSCSVAMISHPPPASSTSVAGGGSTGGGALNSTVGDLAVVFGSITFFSTDVTYVASPPQTTIVVTAIPLYWNNAGYAYSNPSLPSQTFLCSESACLLSNLNAAGMLWTLQASVQANASAVSNTAVGYTDGVSANNNLVPPPQVRSCSTSTTYSGDTGLFFTCEWDLVPGINEYVAMYTFEPQHDNSWYPFFNDIDAWRNNTAVLLTAGGNDYISFTYEAPLYCCEYPYGATSGVEYYDTRYAVYLIAVPSGNVFVPPSAICIWEDTESAPSSCVYQ